MVCLICCCCGEWSGGKADTFVGRVKHGVEALEERETVNEVEALTAGGAEVVDNEIYVAGSTSDVSVDATRPRLSISSEFEGGLER